jgi:hypothetical protein
VIATYRTAGDLLLLKQRMDEANISDEDRAVILDWNEGWRRELGRMSALGVPLDSTHPKPTMVFGFRIVWRTTVTAYEYMT